MNRTFMFLSAVLGFGAMVYLASVSHAQPAGPPGGAPAPSARPTIAVFNMAAVMREFGEAKYKVYELFQSAERQARAVMAPLATHRE